MSIDKPSPESKSIFHYYLYSHKPALDVCGKSGSMFKDAISSTDLKQVEIYIPVYKCNYTKILKSKMKSKKTHQYTLHECECSIMTTLKQKYQMFELSDDIKYFKNDEGAYIETKGKNIDVAVEVYQTMLNSKPPYIIFID